MNRLLPVDREIARGLVACAREDRSGVVRCTRGKLKRLFCLEHGRLSFAASNVIEEQLIECLARDRRVSPEALGAAMNARAANPEIKLSRWLVERGFVDASTMETARAEHVRELLYDTLDWMDGECVIERGRPVLAGELAVDLAVPAVLFGYAERRPASLDLVRMRIGPPNACPVLSGSAPKLMKSLSIDQDTRGLVDRCDGKHTVGELVEASPAQPERTWRMLYGLVLSGILEPEMHRARTAAPTDEVSREEILARLARTEGADHYVVLEQMPTAKPDEIRAAYYFLARRYHPDRFRNGPLGDLLPRMESYFTQVTGAYNTLSDPELRLAYDEQRGESAKPKRPEQNTRELARQNYLHARGLIEKGRHTDAVTSLENALQLDNSVAEYHFELGRLLARNPRRRDDARALLEQANRIDPALVDGYLMLGDLELRMGRRAEAVVLFREVLRWEPGHLEASRRLEELGEAEGSTGGFRGLFGS